MAAAIIEFTDVDQPSARSLSLSAQVPGRLIWAVESFRGTGASPKRMKLLLFCGRVVGTEVGIPLVGNYVRLGLRLRNGRLCGGHVYGARGQARGTM
jgi:hypothetical protein